MRYLSSTELSFNVTLNSVAGRPHTIEFFRNASCDPLGFGEAQTSIAVATLGAIDPIVNLTMTVPAAMVAAGESITAIVTSSDGSSEVSACLPIGAPTAFAVTNTSDSGPGSLRQAILDANARTGLDTITFSIPGAGPFTIAPVSPLPVVTEPVIIDGTTQPGFSGTPLVELSGVNSPSPLQSGLNLQGGNSTVRGLVINRWDFVGIGISSQGNVIEGNYIGTDVSGTLARPNLFIGVSVDSNNNRIGGPAPHQRNVISGNGGFGVRVTGSDNVVQGNYIGTNRTATAAVRNEFTGVVVQNSNNTIGGPSAADGNVISGNGQYGLIVAGANLLQSNSIGANAAGDGGIANHAGGVQISGNGATLTANIVAFNHGNGVSINGGTQNGLSANRIFSNAGLGIDIADSLGTPSSFIDFEDELDNIAVGTAFPTLVEGVTWTNWLHYAPYPTAFLPHGINAVYAAVDGARMTFSPRVFAGARFSRFSSAPGDVYFELYQGGVLVWTSAVLSDVPPQLTFLPSGYTGLVDEVRVRSLGPSMTPIGSAWIMDDVIFGNGVTPNDPGDVDGSTNGLQNFPVLDAVAGGIEGTLNSTPNSTFRIELFISPSCDPSLHGEGQSFLGSVDVTTDGSGNAAIPFAAAAAGQFITATATSSTNDTSEFSACVELVAALPTVTLVATDPVASEIGADPGTFTFSRTGSVTDPLDVFYSIGGNVSGTDYTPTLPGSVTIPAGQSSATITITPVPDALAEGDETVIFTLLDNPGYDLGTPTTATVTIADSTTSGSLVNGAMHLGVISAEGQVDTWTFDAVAGVRIAVHIGEIVDDNDFRPWIRLESPTGAVLANVSGTDAAVVDDVVAPATGTYRVRVASFDSGLDGTGTYRLTMTHTPGPITVSPGDEGGPLTNGATHTGAIVQGDVDVWTFTATAGERIAVHVGEITETDDFRPWMRLWAPNGRHFGRHGGRGSRRHRRCRGAGDGHVPASGCELRPGRRRHRHLPADDDAHAGADHGITRRRGGPLTNGATHTGEITRGDVDVWTFTATAGERIAVHVGELTETDDFRPWLRLWSPTGASLGDTAGVAADVIDDVVAPVTGTYLLLVASFDPGVDGTGTYRLTMTHTPGPITVSPGDEGGPLTNGATHTGEIVRGDVDVWTFTATAGERIAVHVGELTETDDFRPWLRLWAPNGRQSGRHGGRGSRRHRRCRGAGDGHVPASGCELRPGRRRHRHLPADDDAHAGADHGITRRRGGAADQRRDTHR